MTRRRFLGCAAGAASMALPLGVLRSWQSSSAVILDLKEHCLSEAVSGYESALAGLGTRCMRVAARSVSRCSALIVPAAVEIAAPALRTIGAALEAGVCVILESGAGFASEPEFRAHRAVLRDSLQVPIEQPIHLWTTHARSHRAPYVDYTWPYATKVRDFSRVVPLANQAGEIIARVDSVPVALKRQIGRGTLIFLGSPLGPALWAGDAQARRWLSDVLALTLGLLDEGRGRDGV